MPATTRTSPVTDAVRFSALDPQHMLPAAAAARDIALTPDLFEVAEQLRHSAAYCDALCRAMPADEDEDARS